MIRSTQHVVAFVPLFDAGPTRRSFNGRSAIGHTLQRLKRCEQLDNIALLHDATLDDQAVAHLHELVADDARLHVVTTQSPLADDDHAALLAARSFTPTAWRGGIRGLTCYDEILAPRAMAEAITQLDATAALLAGPDWVLIDPALCDAVIARHRGEPKRLTLTFMQAAVGFCGCVVERGLMGELAEKGATIGSVLEYSVSRPQGDPIAKDLCVQVEPTVRNAGFRATFDAPRSQQLLRAVEHEADLLTLSAEQIIARINADPAIAAPAAPQHVTLELTPRRVPTGPLVPQHHVSLDREDLPLATARQIIQRIAEVPDATLTLGGLGDALLHDDWAAVVAAAREAGIRGIHIETDLLVDRDTLDDLLDAEVDVLSVRLNADSAATYQHLMGVDRFADVLGNIEYLLNAQRERQQQTGRRWPRPAIVPRLAKTADNVGEIESFFDRWTWFCGHAVIDSPSTGCGSMPDLAVVDMAGPRRRPCRQLDHRMSVLSNGRVALCDQDWLAAGSTTDAAAAALADAWQQLDDIRELHRTGRAAEHALCGNCSQWHRP